MRERFQLLVWIIASAQAGCLPAAPSPGLSAADERQIRALDSAYVAAWMRDDTAAVVATLAPDAVLMPGGHRPLETPAQISEFWWPHDGSQTRVTTFARQIEELSGGHDFAFVRGRDSVAFTYRKGTISASQVSRTMTLSVVRRGRDGCWRISRMMWATRSD